jgi:hypothetical protein
MNKDTTEDTSNEEINPQELSCSLVSDNEIYATSTHSSFVSTPIPLASPTTNDFTAASQGSCVPLNDTNTEVIEKTSRLLRKIKPVRK